MRMQAIMDSRRSVVSVLSVPLLAMFLNIALAPPADAEDAIRVENVRWNLDGALVMIWYDLIGPTENTYEVSLEFLQQSNSNFKIKPKNVRGDVGTGKFSGQNKTVGWAYSEDLADGFEFDPRDHFFRVRAQAKGGSFLGRTKWLLGGAVVVGLAALIPSLVDGGDEPAEDHLPLPPGRP